jgi:hypothetical protein
MLVAFFLAGPSRGFAQNSGKGKPQEVGTWAPLVNPAPETLGTCLLLSDGTVMCNGLLNNTWYRLTPDTTGSYVNGTWTQLASSFDSRLYFVTYVLRDGRVFVAGGEYGTGGDKAEVYQPIDNTWTRLPDPGITISDGAAEVLPNGNVLVNPVYAGLGTLIFDIVANTWLSGPNLLGNNNESTWVKLPDTSILTIDINSTNSERYIPSLNQWIPDSPLPEIIWTVSAGEIGAGFLLPNRKAFFLGGNGRTAIYTPSGNTSPGTWTVGAVIPDNHGANDAPAAMMANGRILCAFGSTVDIFASPTFFYEYDYVTNTFTPVSSPTGGPSYDMPPFIETMLDLPDGSVLFRGATNQAYVYTPAGKQLEGLAKTVIQTVTQNPDGSYHVTGTRFNGVSAGAGYGDDVQMNTNFPIARLTDQDGNVYYARTYNWSSTGLQTGNNKVSTEMTLPVGLPAGKYKLFIIANGISSKGGHPIQYQPSH